jgi:hypothetical protein
MQNSSLHSFFDRVYLADFDVDLRKLIFEQQARSHCILIASMDRIGSTIDLKDKVLARKSMRRVPIFHETPPSVASRHRYVSVSMPHAQKFRPILGFKLGLFGSEMWNLVVCCVIATKGSFRAYPAVIKREITNHFAWLSDLTGGACLAHF